MSGQGTPAAQGWFESIKEKLNISDFLSKLDLSTQRLVGVFAYLGVGVLSGFLIKRYAKYVIFYMLILAAILWAMTYAGVVTFHWDVLKSFFKFDATTSVESVLNVYIAWIKAHILEVIGAAIGFIIGLKIG